MEKRLAGKNASIESRPRLNWSSKLATNEPHKLRLIAYISTARPYKTSAQNREKLPHTHPVAKYPQWINLLSCPCGHYINCEKSEVFLYQIVRTSASEEPSSPIVRTRQLPSFFPNCERLLWTAPILLDSFTSEKNNFRRMN